MLRLDAPFVLLDDARDGGAAARLYTAPVGIVAAYTPQEVVPALERLRQARRDGLHAAGLIAYEAGAALEPNVPAAAIDGPLLWFGLFQDYRTLAVDAMLPDPAGAWIGACGA